MRILQVINAYYPPYSSGGVAFVAHNISKALVKRGHEVTVYTTNALNRDELFQPKRSLSYDNGVKVYYFMNQIYKPSIHIYFSRDLVEALKKSINRYDLVHSHEYRSYISLVISYYAKRYSVPYILQAHGQLPRISAWRKLKWFYDVLFGYRLLRDAARVIALSYVEAEQYRAMGVPEEKIAIIPNGIDLSEYVNLPPKGAFKKKFNIPEDRKIILYLGRIHKIKGIDILIKAYAYLRNEINFRDAILVIIGPDDGYLNEVKRLAQALGVSNYVLFTGPLYGEDKLATYVDSEVYVLPSRYEIWGMTVLEAYACGKPIVASRVSGLKDLVIDEETGLLFEPGNVKQLAKSIFNLLNGNDVARKMGLKGKNFVRENFAIEKVVERLEKVYEEVVKGKVA
jgi:glycosyltransferase involved in cell wall biosynthesis